MCMHMGKDHVTVSYMSLLATLEVNKGLFQISTLFLLGVTRKLENDFKAGSWK